MIEDLWVPKSFLYADGDSEQELGQLAAAHPNSAQRAGFQHPVAPADLTAAVAVDMEEDGGIPSVLGSLVGEGLGP
jgi:hypothetical protein